MPTNVYVNFEPEGEPIRERLRAADKMWTAGSVHEDDHRMWLSVHADDKQAARVSADMLLKRLCADAGIDARLVRWRLEPYD